MDGRTIGAYEAKTHLPRLLDEVARGATITITKHGAPVAMLVPPPRAPKMTMEEIIEGFAELRKHTRPLGDITLRQLIEEGRRY
jgi:prevent-host-death family protein